MTDVTITALPAAPLQAMEIWSNAVAVARRFEEQSGWSLPRLGQSGQRGQTCLIRYEPTVWLIEGDSAGFAEILAGDGALTAIGGGIVRVRLQGLAWRRLLMEGAVFDAESPDFTSGCSASTVIDHVNVRLLVESQDSCLAYVPLSFAADMIHFWEHVVL